jgi:hypothetical protein
MASSFLRVLDHTQRRTTVGRTPLDEWSAHHKDLYLTAHNSHNKHPCPGWIRTHNLSRQAAADLHLRPHGHCGTGIWNTVSFFFFLLFWKKILSLLMSLMLNCHTYIEKIAVALSRSMKFWHLAIMVTRIPQNIKLSTQSWRLLFHQSAWLMFYYDQSCDV